MEMKILALVIIFLMLIIHLIRPEQKQAQQKEQKKPKPAPPEKPVSIEKPAPTPITQKAKPIDEKPTYHASLTTLLSEQVQAVYYILVNDPYSKINFPTYDTPDQAVLISFSNGKWLNWVWREEGLHEKPEFYLSFSDERKVLTDSFARCVEVSNKGHWKPLIGKLLQGFHLELKEITKEETYLSELHLSLSNGKVVLRAIEEPPVSGEVDPGTLPFANDWILVHFDLP